MSAGDVMLAHVERKRGREELRVQMREYNGVTYCDIRIWFYDAASGDWRPGKGASIRMSELHIVSDALVKACEMAKAVKR